MTRVCWSCYPNFQASEFKCGCGCEKEHVEMDCRLLFILQAIRSKYGVVNITSGFRCKKYNDSLDGSVTNSDHLKGYAADFRVATMMSTAAKRLEVMKFASELPGFKYAYCNGYIIKNGKTYTYKAAWMGKAIHISVN